jgi:DNA topoisomerase I
MLNYSNLLIIVESPTKCKTIAEYLKSDKSNTYVLASYGHIRKLPAKNGSVLPGENFKMIWENNPNSSKYIANIIERAKFIQKNNGTILLATDPDREGEAIAWHIAEVLKENNIKCNTKRIVFQEITKSKILEAMKNPTEIGHNKVHSYFARLGLDYLVGFSVSPILWTKIKGCRSAGRVQSAALRAIVDRELEIIRFNSQKYWSLSAMFGIKNKDYKAELVEWEKKPVTKFMWNAESVNEAKIKLEKDKYHIDSIEHKKHSRSPYAPFTTSTMQQEASSKLGWKPSKTAKVAQQLYEGIKINGTTVGLITYMRTDSIRMSDEAVKECLGFIESNYGKDYKAMRQYENKSKNAQDAHEAIRPTQFSRNPASIIDALDEDMYKLYNLIWRRATASQMSDAEYNITNIFIGGENGKWKIHGRECKFEGFLAVYPEDTNDSQVLDSIAKDNGTDCREVTANEHATQPKGRFTEAGLIKHLDEAGIGRPSTYASIIQTLEDRDYISKDNKKIFPIAKGWIVTGFLDECCPEYIQDEFTARVEEELDQIATGNAGWTDVLNSFWNKFTDILRIMKESNPQEMLAKISNKYTDYFFGREEDPVNCPKCKTGKKKLCLMKDGEFLGCSNHPNCDWKQGLTQKESKILGIDAESGEEILIKDGPYGSYLNWSQAGKNVSITPAIANNINLDLAMQLKKLPVILGKHPYTGKEIKMNMGRYGPYLFYDAIYVSCKVQNLSDMTLERALELIGASKKKPKSEENVAEEKTIPAKGKTFVKRNVKSEK